MYQTPHQQLCVEHFIQPQQHGNSLQTEDLLSQLLEALTKCLLRQGLSSSQLPPPHQGPSLEEAYTQWQNDRSLASLGNSKTISAFSMLHEK